MSEGNGTTDLNVLEALLVEAASVKSADYVLSDYVPSAHNKIIGDCTPIMKQLHTLQARTYEEMTPLTKKSQAFGVEMQTAINKLSDIASIADYLDKPDVREKIARSKEADNRLNTLRVRHSLITAVLTSETMRLFPELTTWENLEIKRRLTNTVSEQQVAEWLERLGMKDKKNSLGSTLSYGEQQRVAIIRALLQPFDWLLMDEPFSHLDHANIDKSRALILEVVQKNNAGMILADLDGNSYFPYTQTMIL